MKPFDVGIIGGGPAGAAMAAYLARAGARCVVIERELFPRPHVGESLVPSSNRIFQELGFLETMEKSGFPRKYGAAWTSSRGGPAFSHDWRDLAGDGHVDVSFSERRQPGVDQDYTYHVDRAKFDLLLLEHARKLGAEVREGLAVASVDFFPKVPEIRCVGKKGPVKIPARMICDASGRRTLLGTQLGLKVMDPLFDQFALHSWFEGYDRGSGPKKDYIYVHFLPISNSWIWQIPITETTTSVGVVTQRKHFQKSRKSREAFFWACLKSRPEMLERVRQARQLRPLKEEGDYSYAMRRICGDRFMLLGDAGRFVDPIFSSGVSIALNSARFGSRDVLKALESGDFSRRSFREFETTMRRGTRHWYEFITAFYRLNILFTRFVADKRYRLKILKLLQGDLYDAREPAVLRRMREVVSEVERDPDHLWHSLLGSLTADAFNPRKL